MNYQKLLVPVLGVVLIAAAWQGYGWGGVALVAGGVRQALACESAHRQVWMQRRCPGGMTCWIRRKDCWRARRRRWMLV